MFEHMEKRYNVRILDDSFWDPLRQTYCKRYKIITADGCSWENGLSYRSLQKECSKYKDTFANIANSISRLSSI